MTRASFTVPVAGGALHGGQWRADEPGTPVLAVHGITASHRAWDETAALLAPRRVIAPDLRGRGRSNALPGPYSLDDHAADLAGLVRGLGLDRVFVVGHSMGAFVAVRFAAAHPELVAGVVLVDGGLPIPAPAGLAPEAVAEAILGPAVERLSMTFADAAEYEAFWRAHPALGPYWNQAIADYVRYDLDGTAPRLRPSSNAAAVGVNALELDSPGHPKALAALGPVDFVRAPRGMFDQPEALYPPELVADWAGRLPDLRVHEAEDVNHYTIIMTPAGAEQIAPLVTARLSELDEEARR